LVEWYVNQCYVCVVGGFKLGVI